MTYQQKIYNFLTAMAPGSSYAVADICKHDTRQLFIDEVKKCISQHWYSFGWKIDFNADYTVIRRNSSPPNGTFDQFVGNKK